MEKTSIDTASLYAALDEVRAKRGWSWRALAGEAGVSPSLLSRLGNGLKPDANGFATLVTWLGVPAEQFFKGADGAHATSQDQQPDLMAQIAPLLRARKDLGADDVKYLQELIRVAVRHVQAKSDV
jgi:transcriptional regulator with XRE-family HTH domain